MNKIFELTSSKRMPLSHAILTLLALFMTTADPASGQLEQAWVVDFSGREEDTPSAISIDAEANVYVTGIYGNPNGSGRTAYGTIKYNSNGGVLWERSFQTTSLNCEQDYNFPKALAIDAVGDAYVTGNSCYSIISTVKYDKDGNEIWAASYETELATNEATAFALDANGNVLITGFTAAADPQITGSEDYITLKYDPNGNLLWVKRYNGPDNSNDQATAIAVDAAGNVYVTGYSKRVNVFDILGNGTEPDFLTIKYDTNGNELWAVRYRFPDRYNTNDMPTAIAVDDTGNVYITGYHFTDDSNITRMVDYVTLKYDPNGNLLWVKRYNGPDNSNDQATAIAVDAAGNVYVTGDSATSILIQAMHDYATIKYDINGNQVWVARYDSSGDDYARAIRVDSAGDVYVMGYSTGDPVKYNIVKYDPEGNELWVSRHDGASSPSFAMDNAGNVYATGRIINSFIQGGDYNTSKLVPIESGGGNDAAGGNGGGGGGSSCFLNTIAH